jgi:hypothetical protein
MYHLSDKRCAADVASQDDQDFRLVGITIK